MRIRHSKGVETGASLVEYMLLALSIMVVALAGVANFGDQLGTNMNNAASSLGGAMQEAGQ